MRSLVLLHGFTGAPDAWDEVVARLPSRCAVLRPAIGGHDGTPAPASFEGEVERLAQLIRRELPSRPHLCGYSLGGRVAFGLLATHAGAFSGATIVSANPGLTNEGDRRARAKNDDAWADMAIARGVAAFIDEWEKQPLFATQIELPAHVRDAQRERRLRHDAHGLAGAMRALSLARMPSYARALAQMDLPITLVTGAADLKFYAMAAALAGDLRRAEHRVVPGAGHNVVLERPDVLAEILALAVGA